MLVLSRRTGETIVADDIKFTVLEIKGDKVRIGIEAPREKAVHRGEVWAEIEAAKAEQAVAP